MAAIKATTIYSYGDPVFGRVTLPKKTAADVLEVGHFLKFTATGVELTDATADDATFVGICGTDSDGADGPSNILVYQQCIIEAPSVSVAYNLGDGLSLVVADAATLDDSAPLLNVVCWAWKDYTAVTTSVKVLVDVRALGKLYPTD